MFYKFAVYIHMWVFCTGCSLSENYLTFKLWYLPCRAFRQSFMACITSQGHSNSTASKQETYLLTTCILIDHKTGGKNINQK